jgi:uncharacterized protein (TIGR02246 family)
MNRKSIWVLAAILTLVAGCAPKIDAPADVAAIKAMAAAWGPAETAGDAAALTEQYADGAFQLPPNGSIRVGKEAIQSAFRTDFDQSIHETADVAEDVRVVGDLAFARGTYAAKSTPKVPGAAIVDDKGKWLTAYRRQADGSWKIVVDIWNSDLPVVQVLAPVSADEQALLQLERDWTAAWLKQDAAAMDAILAEGYVENANGQTTLKKQYVADMKAGIYKVESAEASDMRVVVFGDHAVVNGSSASKYTMRGKDASRKTRWTDTFEKRDGRWRAVVSYIVKIE